MPEFGNFTDSAGVATGMERYFGRLPGVLFAVALIDASIIGACAVSLSTAYAIGDVLSLRHSLHRKVTDAKGFYSVYCGLIVVAAGLVLVPGAPLGLLTNAVQTLAGVLLPSATVFLLLLCNDKAVLGPWINSRGLNIFTSAIVAILVMLSVILTASVVFPDATDEKVILGILGGGSLLAILITIGAGAVAATRKSVTAGGAAAVVADREIWRMPPLDALPPARLSLQKLIWMGVLRVYLAFAGGLVLVRIVTLAISPG
jgi:hypothetical protein